MLHSARPPARQIEFWSFGSLFRRTGMRLLASFRLNSFTLVVVCSIAAALAVAAGLRSRVAQASADRERHRAANSSLTNTPLSPAGSTYTWVGGTPVVTTDWTVAT